jgi:hypothetical protein
MTAPHIVIPTAARAGAVLTNVDGAILIVDEREVATYREHHPSAEIETHPPLRNLAAKRQWIYERFGSVFMLDDDIAFVSRLYLPGNNRDTHLTPHEAAALIHSTADAAKQAGCHLYGFNATPNAKHYYPHKPIELTTYINASAFGLHPSPNLYFTERTTAAESHWINLLNAYFHRRAWVDMRFHFAQAPGSTFTRPGGQTMHRTKASERDDTLFLRRMFGQSVQIKAARGDAKLIHPYQRTIRNPL